MPTGKKKVESETLGVVRNRMVKNAVAGRVVHGETDADNGVKQWR
jgi:hypothetical protein